MHVVMKRLSDLVSPQRRPHAVQTAARILAAAFAIGLLAGTSLARADDMAFKLVALSDPQACRSATKCVDVIVADGEIVDATPQAFMSFLAKSMDDNRLRTVVFINSPGGKVVASMQLGQMFRKVGAMTVVARVVAPPPGSGLNAAFASARCYSACVYALMGGKKRIAPPQSSIGIHRMFNVVGGRDPAGFSEEPQKVYDAGLLGGKLSAYAGMMGVSPDLVTTAERISSDNIHILTPAELRRWRLASQKF